MRPTRRHPYVRFMTRRNARTHDERLRPNRLRTRWAAIGAAIAVSIGAAGVGGFGLVSAEVSTGDRPVFVPITPCRLVDTRPAPNNVGVQPAPMGPKDTYVIQVRGNTDPCPATIANDASGLSLNVTALNATQQSFLTFWGDGPNPGTANLNPAPGQPPIPNAVNTPLGSNGSFQMYNEAGTVDVVIDVNGYYVSHNHDDLYAKIGDAYTKAEADGAFAAVGDAYTKAEVDGTFAKIGNTYDRAQLDARYIQPIEVDNKIDAAKGSGQSAAKAACTNDTTGPGDLNEGVFQICSSVDTGLTISHVALITVDIGWKALGAPTRGECRVERNGTPVTETTISMGEVTDTTGATYHSFASLNRVTGPHTGTAIYSVSCRETEGDMDWVDITLSVVNIPV